MMERWRGPLLLLAVAWVLLAVVWTAVEVVGYVTGGATAFEVAHTLVRLGGVAVVIWILRSARQRRRSDSN